VVAGVHLKDRYLVDRYPLAHQGMGEVWPAWDTVLGRPVIVKLIAAAVLDADVARRFKREAQLTARFVHPGVPAVYDFGQHDGRFYLILQKITGVALSDLIDEHSPVPIAWVAAIGAQISSVLIVARQIRLIHRDIKPSNAMLEPSGAVKVLDFGLAAMPGDDRYSQITQSGDSLGTAGYMAPEQIEGGPADHRTDLYGLGATLFDLLTGQPPFDDPSPTMTMRRQLQASPPRPAKLRDEVPASVDNLVHALMARRPQDRPSSAAAVYAVLAPLARDLPPIPGVVSDQPDAVRAYSAVVGQAPVSTRAASQENIALDDASPERAAASADEQAERLAATGQSRAAARLWRQLADERAAQYGDEDDQGLNYRLRALRLHVGLGERDRALRQLRTLLHQRIEVHGPEHPAVLAIQREIAQLSEDASEPGAR
jgi:eukaryotic-like serine/threonine-protein kinase